MTDLFTQDTYIIREKFLRVFGNVFWVTTLEGEHIAYCRQKRLRIKEDIRLYPSEESFRSGGQELVVIRARNIIDAWGGYDIFDAATGQSVGSARRKALKSLIRDNWTIFDAAGNEIGTMKEDSMGKALLRRLIPLGTLFPQRFDFEIPGQAPIQLYQLFNPIFRRLQVRIPPEHPIDRRLVAGLAILVSAIEGRQNR